MNPEVRNFLILVVVVIILFWWVFPSFVCNEKFSDIGCKNKQPFGSAQIKDLSNPLQLYNPNLYAATAGSMLAGIIPQDIYSAGGYDADCDLEKTDIADAGLAYDSCSPSCCAPQYPPPFSLGNDPVMTGTEGEFIGTSYNCNNAWQNSGCLCMTKKQGEFLSARGGNGAGNYDVRSLQ